MHLTPRLRKFAFLSHVSFSVGWLGAVVAYLAMAISGLRTQDPTTARSAYLSMELVGWWVIVPLSLAALLSDLLQSLGTEWGLFRHYWITVKFLMTSVSSVILLVHMRAVGQMAGFARTTLLSTDDFGDLRISLTIHAAGGLLVLLAATTLSIYKPWGVTPYGRGRLALTADCELPRNPVAPQSRRRMYIGLGIVVLILLLLVLHHLAGGGLHHH